MKFPKIKRGGSKAVWTFFKKTSIIGETVVSNFSEDKKLLKVTFFVTKKS